MRSQTPFRPLAQTDGIRADIANELASEQSFASLVAADFSDPDPQWSHALGNSSMPSAAIPEPQAAAMWLVGLVVFGFIALRRRGGRGSMRPAMPFDRA